ncbi:MAG: DUF2232 domain-containing protein, partial [Desulfobacula sp.]
MTGTQIQSTLIKDILIGILVYVLIFAGMYAMPLTGVTTWLFLPLPVLFYRLKTGRNVGIAIMLTSLAILMLVTHNFAMITFYFGSLLMTGFVLGECIENHFSIGKIMLFTCLIVFGLCFVGVFIYSTTQGQDIRQVMSGYIANYHAMSGEFFSELERLYPEMSLDRQMFEKENSVILMAAPGIFINSYLMMLWLNILLMKKILFKKGIIVKSIENLNRWKAPDHLVFGLIAMAALIFFTSGVLKFITVNLLIVLLFVYFFQGIAVVSFFFQKKRTPFAIRFFFYLMVAILPQFLFLVTG